MMDVRRILMARRVRREERVRRAAPVRKMLSWLREPVGEEVVGGRRGSEVDMFGRMKRWRSAMKLSKVTMDAGT